MRFEKELAIGSNAANRMKLKSSLLVKSATRNVLRNESVANFRLPAV